MERLLDLARLDAHVPDPAPFPLLVVPGMLAGSDQSALTSGFPRYRSAGFFPYAAGDCGAAVQRLVDEMTSRGFGDAIGARLGLPDLGELPTLVTLCSSLNRRHGTIHTDSRAKVATALLYLNPEWTAGSAGCLRFLHRIDDIDSLVRPEIPPVFGTLAAFRRAENSFHGHLPFEGERLVVQVAWLTSQDEKHRKTRRGRVSRMVKRVLGALDRRVGAGRDRNAAHRD